MSRANGLLAKSVRATSLGWGLLFLGFGSAQTQAPSPPLVLNEVLYYEDPANPNLNRAQEWIEIYNRSSSPVNLAGWVISNRDGRSGTKARILPTLNMPPGTYLVVHFAAGTNDYSFTNNAAQYTRAIRPASICLIISATM
jgi:hypothetical protein